MKHKFLFLYTILCGFTLSAQPLNDNCENATVLCYNQVFTGTTNNATAETCFDCADDYPNTIGFTSSSSVWYVFTTNAMGGDVTISINNISFNSDPSYGQALQAVIWEVSSPCHGQSYNPIGVPQNNGTSNFTLSATGLQPNTTYYVMVNGDNTGAGVSNPAEATFDISITGPGVVVTLPSASISAVNTTICQGDVVPVTYTINDCQNLSSLKWYFNNQFLQDSSNVNTALFTENGYLKLIVECGTDCIYRDTTDSIYFEVTPIFVDAGEDKLIELGESVVLNGTGTSNPIWTPETGLSSTTTFTPTATPSETTTYFLTVTNGNCSLTDEVTVKIKEIITIPTGFTPNQDGTNDVWEIININQYPNNIVRVYDRSGQLVFKTTGYKNFDNNWDGSYLGKPLPVSTYYYVIDLRNGSNNSLFKGFVTIIR